MAYIAKMARIEDSARVVDSAWVGGSARVGDLARIEGSQHIAWGQLLDYSWTAYRCLKDRKYYRMLQYGCEIHSIADWRKNIKSLVAKCVSLKFRSRYITNLESLFDFVNSAISLKG